MAGTITVSVGSLNSTHSNPDNTKSAAIIRRFVRASGADVEAMTNQQILDECNLLLRRHMIDMAKGDSYHQEQKVFQTGINERLSAENDF